MTDPGFDSTNASTSRGGTPGDDPGGFSPEERRLLEILRPQLGHLLALRPLAAPHAECVFETLATLGEGGMGSVLRVHDKRLDRELALKIMQPAERSNRLAVRRFQREARITARLVHPSIPPIHEAGIAPDGSNFFVMRIVEGDTLAERLRRYREDDTLVEHRRELLAILQRVAEALAYAHSRGIVHRDVKPSNIMVGAFGEVMVMDWGLARDLASGEDDGALEGRELEAAELEAEGVTLAGAVLGTPGYMSPEAARGEAVDARSDVYALGLMLTELLTGEPAIGGESSLVRIVGCAMGRRATPRSLDPSVPRDLDWLADRATDAEPERRLEDAEAFAEGIAAWLAGEPVPGCPYSLGERALRQVRRRPAALLAALGALAIAAFTSLVMARLETLARESAEQRSRIAETERQAAAAESKAQVAKLQADYAKAEVDRARALIERLSKARVLAERRAPAAKIRPLLVSALELSERSQPALMEAAGVYRQAALDDDAEVLLREVAERFPPAYDALFRIHELESRRAGGGPGVFVETPAFLELVKRAGRRGDTNEFTLFCRAAALRQSGRVEEAVKVLETVEDHSRSFAPALLLRAILKLVQGRVDEGLGDVEETLRLEPRNPEAWAARSRVREMREDFRGARDDLDQALRWGSGIAALWFNRAVIVHRLGESTRALSDVERALELKPDYAKARLLRAQIRLESGRAAESLPDFDAAARALPDNVSVFSLRGKAHALLGQWNEAERDLGRAIELGDAIQLGNRGLIRRQLGRNREALADFKAFLRRFPKAPKAATYRRHIAELEGR